MGPAGQGWTREYRAPVVLVQMCAGGLRECGYGDHDTPQQRQQAALAREAGAMVPSLHHRRLHINGLRIQRPTPAVFYTLRKRPAIDWRTTNHFNKFDGSGSSSPTSYGPRSFLFNACILMGCCNLVILDAGNRPIEKIGRFDANPPLPNSLP